MAVEQLEPRYLLAADSVAFPNVIRMRPADMPSVNVVGYTPAQLRAAYSFDQVTLTDLHGNAVAATGAGQTIAIIDAFSDPNIGAEAATFSQQFGLPQFNVPGGPTLKVMSQAGSTVYLPLPDPNWSVEIALDVEWAHAIAPGANILLVEANTNSFSDLLLAMNKAKVQPGVSVVSISWGGDEFPGETVWDSAFIPRRTSPFQTFVVDSGDDGSPPEWPGTSPFVVTVGGTSLQISGNAYAGETGWSGSTGGVAAFEAEPLFQWRVQNTGLRSNPDVAYDGDPYTGVAVYLAASYGNPAGWAEIGGTSAGAPQWSALFAIADQGRALKGLPPLAGAQSALYNLPASDFHDITAGNNGGFNAGPGYDGVTGLGSPRANLIIPHLISGVPAGAGAPVSSNTGIVLSQFVSAASSPRLLPAAVVAGATDKTTTTIEVGGGAAKAHQRAEQASVLEDQHRISHAGSSMPSVAVSNYLGAASDIDSVNESNGTTHRDRSRPQDDKDVLDAIPYNHGLHE
jgi:subtilase family serine protease